MLEQALVEILEVQRLSFDSERLCNFAIDQPYNRQKINSYAIDVSGWVLGKNLPAVAIELIADGRLLRRTPCNQDRPDVAKVYSQVPGAEKSGFSTALGVIALAPVAEIFLEAVFQDSSRVLIGIIRLQHQPLQSHYQPRLQPLMVTSSGRTGTTWLMRLLSQHPQISVHKEYPYELRFSQYWMNALKVLSDPGNDTTSSSEEFNSTLKSVGYNPYCTKKIVCNSEEINSWMWKRPPEVLATSLMQIIDEFYLLHEGYCQSLNAPISQKTIIGNQSIYFAEKFNINYYQWLLWELYPQSREIFLVRDFRDMLCSILAFNSKRNFLDFGRQYATSDEDYVQRLLKGNVEIFLQAWKSRCRRAHLVRYEDLILSPVETLSNILEYLGLEHTPATIANIIEKASEDTPELQDHRTTSDTKASIGRWQHELDASMQTICQEAFGEALQEFGYTTALVRDGYQSIPGVTSTSDILPLEISEEFQQL